jgi:uncharacterized Zn finger protein
MPREDALTKGKRYLTEARLQVVTIEPDLIQATCKGSGVEWHLGWRPGGWWCNCPARTLCAHLVALQCVTIAPEGAAPEEAPF